MMITRIAVLIAIVGGLATAQEATEKPKSSGPITMHIDGQHPNDVFAELQKQTGVTVYVWPENLWEQYKHNNPPPPTTISVDVDNKTFWEVMSQICDAAKLHPTNINNNDGMTLQWQGADSLYGKRPTFVGPEATIVADRIERHHNVDLNNDSPQATRSCGVHLTAYVDPRLHMSKFIRQPIIDTAVDETGAAISPQPQSSNESKEQAYMNWGLQDIFIPLDYDPEKSKKLATLKGALRITVVRESEKLELDLDKDKGQPKAIAGRECTVTDVTDGEHNTSVKFRIIREDLSKEEWHEQYNNIFRNVKLVDANGRSSGNGGGGGGGDDKLEYTFNASWDNEAKKPVKLVWDIPTKIEDDDLPFEFKDLPLP